MLDLVITDMYCSTFHKLLPLINEDVLHPSLCILVEVSINTKTSNPSSQAYNFRKTNHYGLYSVLDTVTGCF